MSRNLRTRRFVNTANEVSRRANSRECPVVNPDIAYILAECCASSRPS